MQQSPRRVETAAAPAALGPYSQAIVCEELGLVFTAGQIGLEPRTGQLADGGVEDETGQAFDNLEAILTAAGSALDRVVRATLYLTDINDFAAVNEVYAKRVGQPFPARSTVEVAALPKGARVEIDLIALLGTPGRAR